MSISTHSLQVNERSVAGYERVIEFTDEITGLHAIVAIHDTRLGPAVGGTRVYPYPTIEAALTDVLRLSKGMSYKAAVAESGTGGGKSVIIADPNKPKPRELLLSFAHAVNTLGGSYICAIDSGITVDDLNILREGTQYILGIPHPKSSGNLSRYTAAGVIKGLKALSQKQWKTDSLKGKTIAIQGLGSVGKRIAEHLFWEEAHLVVTDIDKQKCEEAIQLFGAQIVDPDEIYSVNCDIFCPCAMGAILNPKTIPQLKCEMIGGAANNQLLSPKDGYLLHKRGILYAPDFVLNAGGLINACCEIDEEGYNPKKARRGIDQIYPELLEIFRRSKEQGRSTNAIAEELAEEKLDKGTGKRLTPPVFHH